MNVPKLLARIRLSELSGTSTNIVQVFDDLPPIGDTTLSDLMDNVKVENGLLIIAMNQDKALSELEDFDEKRDSAMRDVYYYVQGCTHLPAGDAAVAADKLFTLLKKYSVGITQYSYNQETGEINSLLVELATVENSARIATIPQLDTLVATLETTQRAFEQAYSSYLSQISENKNKQSASSIKPLLLDLINDRLVIYLRSKAIFSPEVYGAFADKVATAISKTNANIRERFKNAKNN